MATANTGTTPRKRAIPARPSSRSKPPSPCATVLDSRSWTPRGGSLRWNILVTCYTPNAQRGLARIDHRLKWDEAFRAYLSELDREKPVIACGDLNVAHQEIDLKNPASNRGNAGFSDEERESFGRLLDAGFTDSFRRLHPDATGAYTWWSYMFNARANNAGWRIDYFLVSDRIADKITATPIYSDIQGSDHCPVGLEIEL